MKDLNRIPAACLPQSDEAQQSRQQTLKAFFEDWPEPQQCIESDDPSSIEVKKWRLQILLAVNPYGIPSLKYGQAYERMFGKKFDLREFGCDNLSDLINKMPEIFVVQEPDDVTAVLFPDYPNDRVLHDARLGLNFAQPQLDGQVSPVAPTTRVQATGTNKDFNDLIMRAWLDRDEEFPPDVVLAGESYEHLLKISAANIPGTKGLYQATIISAASPDSMFIQLKSTEEDVARTQGLSNEIIQYFKDSTHSIDAYNVPREFMLPGFPCLLYLGKQKAWERCIIAGRSRSDNKILVESIDFGGTYAVHQIYLYLIPRKFLELPRQTLQVSIVGLKPFGGPGEDWSKQVGPRLRCFSYENYWLDILLIEPKYDQQTAASGQSTVGQKNGELVACDSSSSDGRSSSQNSSGGGSESVELRPTKRKFKSRVAYEALIVDRNDDDMDLFIDDVMVLETYATRDASRAEEVANFKKPFLEALANIPRPKNPFEQTGPVID